MFDVFQFDCYAIMLNLIRAFVIRFRISDWLKDSQDSGEWTYEFATFGAILGNY